MHYVRHYEKFIDCDFCGQQTRGRVYDDEPEKVYCGACKNVMIEKGINDGVLVSSGNQNMKIRWLDKYIQ